MKKLLALSFLLAACCSLSAADASKKLGPDIYDTQVDAQVVIDKALVNASASGRHVLLDFGANWCIWCRRLHTLFTTNQTVAAELAADYIVVMVDVNTREGTKRNAAVDEKYGMPSKQGLPALVVLDATGKVLVLQETGALEDGKGHSPDKVMAFLKKWAPVRSEAQNKKPEAGSQSTDRTGKNGIVVQTSGLIDGFDAAADKALLAMKAKAEELKIGGVAVIATFDGKEFRSWSSKAAMVNRYKDAPNAHDTGGANLISIAYAKATEMVDTLKDSGCAERPKMTGELGWKGGVVRAWKKGYLIAAFSGGKSEDDVEVSKAGIAAIVE